MEQNPLLSDEVYVCLEDKSNNVAPNRSMVRLFGFRPSSPAYARRVLKCPDRHHSRQ